MSGETIQLGMKPIEIWPKNLESEVCGDSTIHKLVFTDTREYHPRLIAKILELEENHRLRKRQYDGGCGTKIHHLEKWASTEVELITARARALFRKVLDCEHAVIDLSWANVYRNGDYCPPQSQLRSTASVLYCLDAGDEDAEDSRNGRFCFVDPRLRNCCPHQEGCMTTPFCPEMSAGTMLIFPSQLVHTVNPYAGMRPRITLSWNINKHALPGTALPADAGSEP